MATNSLEIPLRQTGEVLEVDLNDLQGNDTALIGILENEQAPLHLYLVFAFEYFTRHMKHEFERFLIAGSHAAENQIYAREIQIHSLLLNTLASFYVESAKALPDGKRDDQERGSNELLESATALVNKAERLNRLDLLTLVVKGNLMLAKKTFDQASIIFRGALQQNPSYVPALLGMATCSYNRGDYKSALGYYQKVLSIVGSSPAAGLKLDVRVPIALCFDRLGMHALAEKALKRAIEVDPANVSALALQSVMDLNKSKDAALSDSQKEAHVKSSNQKLMKAFQLNPKNVIVANHMGERLLHKGSLDKALVFAETALKNVDGGKGMADAWLLKGRVLQAQGRYDEAFEVFETASKAFPNAGLIRFGLGQMYLYKGNTKDAIACFQKILEKDVNNYECLSILGHLYASGSGSTTDPSQDSQASAKECYEKIKRLLRSYREEAYGVEPDLADEDFISDPNVLIEMGQLYEKTDLRLAGKVYASALRLMQETSSPIPPELQNNLAALFLIDADVSRQVWNESGKDVNAEEASNMIQQALQQVEQLYQEAIVASGAEGQDQSVGEERAEILHSITRYNVARLFEVKGDVDKAIHQYSELLKKHPTFIDCWLRLADHEISNSNLQKAIEYISNCIRVDPKHAVAWNLLGSLHMAAKNYRAARKSFEKVLQEVDRYDVFALCGAGNLCLRFARMDAKQRDIHCKRAVEFFSKALRQTPQNISAAAGIAIAFAERGQFEAAKNTFAQILEASSQSSGAYGAAMIQVNLAHTMVEMGDVFGAIGVYEGILKRSQYANDANLLGAVARAYYIAGRTEKDPSSIAKAIQYVQKAIRANPGNFVHMYNLGLLKQQYSRVMNEQPLQKRSVKDMKKGLNGVRASIKIFEKLSTLSKQQFPRLGYDPLRAKERVSFGKDVERDTKKKIHETETLEKMRREQLEELKRQKEESLAADREREEREKREAEEREREIEAKREELKAKIMEENERARQEAEEEKATVAKRGESSEEEDAVPVEDEPSKDKAKKRKRVPKKPEAEVSADVSDNGEDDDEGAAERKRMRGLASAKSKAIISDSDEESD